MGFQCVPQSIGLVRELKAGQKNRSVGQLICMETGEERASKSTTRDRSRANENVFQVYGDAGWEDMDNPRGEDVWDAMVADADGYRSTYTDKNGKERSRRLPKQSIIGVQVIVNPPSSVADTWDRETHFKFQDDAAEVLEEIEPRLFRRSNAKMRAHHFDEGEPGCAADTHTVYIAKDEEGRYCGSLYDANLRQRMAKEFAEKMRGRGWEIDDPELTDWERYGSDEGYRKRIDAKRQKQGKSQREYDAQQMTERAEKLEQLGLQIHGAADSLKVVKAEIASAYAERDAARAERDVAREKRDKWERSRELIAGDSFTRNGESMLGVAGLEKKRDELTREIANLESTRETKQASIDQFDMELKIKQKKIDEKQREYDGLDEQIADKRKVGEDALTTLQTAYVELSERYRDERDKRVSDSSLWEYMDEVVNDDTVGGTKRFERIMNTPDEYGQTPSHMVEDTFGVKMGTLVRMRMMNILRCVVRVIAQAQRDAVTATKQHNQRQHDERVRAFGELLGGSESTKQDNDYQMSL